MNLGSIKETLDTASPQWNVQMQMSNLFQTNLIAQLFFHNLMELIL